jgi:hypothetical protein
MHVVHILCDSLVLVTVLARTSRLLNGQDASDNEPACHSTFNTQLNSLGQTCMPVGVLLHAAAEKCLS